MPAPRPRHARASVLLPAHRPQKAPPQLPATGIAAAVGRARSASAAVRSDRRRDGGVPHARRQGRRLPWYFADCGGGGAFHGA
eukprot:gene8091-biopygen9135